MHKRPSLSRHLSLSLALCCLQSPFPVIAPDFVFLSPIQHNKKQKKGKRERKEKKKSSVIGIFLKFLVFEALEKTEAHLEKISKLLWQSVLTASLGSLGHRPLGLTSHMYGSRDAHKTCMQTQTEGNLNFLIIKGHDPENPGWGKKHQLTFYMIHNATATEGDAG